MTESLYFVTTKLDDLFLYPSFDVKLDSLSNSDEINIMINETES